MSRPRAFIESPAGLASVSLCLHGGRHCRPPISRTGNKAGFAPAILDLLGLRPGQGAGAYVWVEADPDVRALLRAYPDAALLREVAAIIRGWSDEEPRALWERLREERRARGVTTGAESVGAWLWTTASGHVGGGGFVGEYRALGPTQQAHMGPTTCAKYASAYGTDERGYPLAPQGCSRVEVADRCSRLADTADHGAREVAGWIVAGQWSYRRCQIESGYNSGVAEGMAETASHHGGGPLTAGDLAVRCSRFASAGWPPVAILPTVLSVADLSALLGTPGDLEGVVVYADPPYSATTGYKSADGALLTYPRADVVRDALAYAAAGATVAVSEAVPVGELVAAGWDAVDIMGERRGQRLTFRKASTGEWVTMSRVPLHRPAVQGALFAGGAA